jgi:hypothetical protein
MKRLLILLILITVIVISGCVQQGTTPEKVGEAGKETTTTTVKPVQKFKIGDIVSNSVISIVVNSMSYADSIDTSISGYPYEPKEGNRFLIVDLTIENVGTDTVHVNPYYTTVTDNNDYTYNFDGGTIYLNPKFDAVDLQVGKKTMGKVAYQLSSGSEAKEFIYDDKFREPIVIGLHS